MNIVTVVTDLARVLHHVKSLFVSKDIETEQRRSVGVLDGIHDLGIVVGACFGCTRAFLRQKTSSTTSQAAPFVHTVFELLVGPSRRGRAELKTSSRISIQTHLLQVIWVHLSSRAADTAFICHACIICHRRDIFQT